MPALRVMGFDGVIPRTSPTMLAVTQAQEANNVKLYSGEIRPWAGQELIYQPNAGAIQTIYKLYDGNSGSAWLTWTNVVDVAPGPLADVDENRIYYTGDTTPRKTNWALATVMTPYPANYYEMGVPAPTTAVTATASSAVSPVETRAYVTTFTTGFGSITEESAPSAASNLVDLDSGASVTLTGLPTPPPGAYNFTGINIYRSVAGSTTSNYEFVATVAIGTTTYTDTLLVAELGGTLPSLGWLPPPADLQGIVNMANGCLAGFVGNTVWFSEPDYPHAWPVAYSETLPFEIVGLAAMDGSIAVMTAFNPYLISGSTPGSFSIQQLPLTEPCIAKSTISTNALGTLYASPNGLVSIGAGGAAIITQGVFRRAEWQALGPAQMRGVSYDGKYVGVFLYPNNAQPAIILDPSDVPMMSTLALNASAAVCDTHNGNFYIASAADNNIYQVDANILNPPNFTWTSKRFVNPQAVAMSALKVDAGYDEIAAAAAYAASVAAAIAANTALFSGPTYGRVNDTQVNVYPVNGDNLTLLPPAGATLQVQLAIYGDDALICTINLASLDPVRLPAFKAREIYFTLTGNVSVRSVEMATSVRDLDPKAWSESAQTPSLYT